MDFIKMHGIGNDFVIIDHRESPLSFSKEDVCKIAHRHFGIGCDQVIILKKSMHADCLMHIYNADGSTSDSCGNASRCVASLLSHEKGKTEILLEMRSGSYQKAYLLKNNTVKVDMGKAIFAWDKIPLSSAMHVLDIPLHYPFLPNPVALSVGNPHIVFFVKSLHAIPLHDHGPFLENHAFFPEKTNVNFAEIMTRSSIHLRVWERGTGATLACGTGACASVMAGIKKNLLDPVCQVTLPGGEVWVTLDNEEHLWLEGEVEKIYEGRFTAFL